MNMHNKKIIPSAFGVANIGNVNLFIYNQSKI